MRAEPLRSQKSNQHLLQKRTACQTSSRKPAELKRENVTDAIPGAEHTWRRHYGLPRDDYSRFHPPLLHQSISKKASPHLWPYSLSSLQYSADARAPPGFMRISEALRRIRNAMAAAGAPSLRERRVEGGGGIISGILRELT